MQCRVFNPKHKVRFICLKNLYIWLSNRCKFPVSLVAVLRCFQSYHLNIVLKRCIAVCRLILDLSDILKWAITEYEFWVSGRVDGGFYLLILYVEISQIFIKTTYFKHSLRINWALSSDRFYMIILHINIIKQAIVALTKSL